MDRTGKQGAARDAADIRACGGFSLVPDLLRQVLAETKPVGHHHQSASMNLGFGFVYYGLVRALRPRHVLIIGSGHGFSAVCLALGIKDNRCGILTFVEPTLAWLSSGRPPTAGQVSAWQPAEKVRDHFSRFGVADQITHHRLVCAEFFDRYDELKLPVIDLAFVDGVRAASEVSFDFTQLLRRTRKNTYILVHDKAFSSRRELRHSSVLRWLKVLTKNPEAFECVKFPFAKGLALVRVKRSNAWKQFEPG
ncbi:MAG: O-methyltransferase [Thermodesulfobacteriota bacterium]